MAREITFSLETVNPGRRWRIFSLFGHLRKSNRDWKKGRFKNVMLLEMLEKLEIREIFQTVENKGESDHFLDIRERI